MSTILYLTALLFGLALAQQCSPGSNCNLPDCRCFIDTKIPGGLSPSEVPQMVVVTMDYALNAEYKPLYDQLFTNNNPNNCPALGTFFIQDQNSDYDIIKSYSDRGFEIGVSSVDGTIPEGETEWKSMIKNVKGKLTSAGVPADKIRGYRAPQLSFGGTDMFIGLGDSDLIYDASCVSSEFDTPDNYKWPNTYDFAEGAKCNGASGDVDKEFKGKWQVIFPDFKFVNNTRCEVPQGCTNIKTKKDAFDILFDNFITHYEGNRSPFLVVIDAAWMKTDFKREGTVEFMDYIRAAFPDTFVITVWQALQWVQDPTKLDDIDSFKPWSC